MLYKYNQCIEIYGSNYKLQQAIKRKEMYKIEKGIYSNNKNVSELEVILIKYPNVIFTSYSAFYYHGLTDSIPEYYYCATSKDDTKYKDKRIYQVYENSDSLELGAVLMEYNNTTIKLYNKERMLVELIRTKNKLSLDFYKEVILQYRKNIEQLNMQLIEEYIYALPKKELIFEILQMEVL